MITEIKDAKVGHCACVQCMIEVAEGRECKQTSLSQQSCTEVQHATTKTLQQQDENFENEKNIYNQNESKRDRKPVQNMQK